jgi:hypothetical protein
MVYGLGQGIFFNLHLETNRVDKWVPCSVEHSTISS